MSTINVRGDTLLSTCRSIYSQAKNARRCVVPIDGYYEWQRMPTNGARPLVASRPHHIGYRDGAPLFIAAVFDVCRSKLDPTGTTKLFDGYGALIVSSLSSSSSSSPLADPLYSYALVTTEASPSMQFLHERMPVILEGDEVDRWIDNSIPFAAVKHLIRPYTGPRLVAYEVSAFVGKIGNDTDECIKPYTGPPPRETITHYFSKPSSVAPHSPPASQEDHVIDPPDLLLPDDDDDDDDDGHDGHDGEPVEIESGPEALDERALKRKHEEVASGADEEERPEHRQEEAPRKRVHVTAEQEQSILELGTISMSIVCQRSSPFFCAVGMGFDADKAYDALIRFDFSVERASNYLLDS